MDHVLVLNASFEPLIIVHWQKAIQLVFQEKVEIVEFAEREIKTVSKRFTMPSVLRLIKYIPLNRRRNIIRFSRTNILVRDQFTCQYCGRKRLKAELTLDHVTPSVQGGKKSWENIVAACLQCNQRKGGRTPSEAGMRLISKPQCPEFLPSFAMRYTLKSAPEHWRVYLSWQTTTQQPPAQMVEQILDRALAANGALENY